ncbi:hypothetical protein NDU88_001529 [Pleurodeles waltl]|uniref:Uncharacterized protein n=1 Tax=Pleurodeles waltl TaxID=8319 RepID=A0AAV7UT26_PLEWA|nr:hypothetical protein NDU88_001529 [Pleurodeles waltl]
MQPCWPSGVTPDPGCILHDRGGLLKSCCRQQPSMPLHNESGTPIANVPRVVSRCRFVIGTICVIGLGSPVRVLVASCNACMTGNEESHSFTDGAAPAY